MSKRIKLAHRRLLPLSIAAYLLSALAARLPAGEATGEAAGSHMRTAGMHLSLGFIGHHGHRYGHYWGHYRPYRYHTYRYYPYRYPHTYTYHRDGALRQYGGIDLNVKPKKTTQVYVDGDYVGVAGNFDGWPEYLWLEASRRPAGGANSHQLIFYNPGYETVVRQVETRPGVVVKMRLHMQPGESTPPEELSTAKPKSRPAAPGHQLPAPAERQPAAPRELARPAPQDVLDARRQPARLKLSVAPADASVYLDGHFLGIAGEIGEQRSGILIDPGEHHIEIVRPGYVNHQLRFEAEPRGEVKLEIELEAGASRTSLSV